MKKIMFNDKYGLTKAVLEGRKTQTRRIIDIPDGEELEPYYTKDGILTSVHFRSNRNLILNPAYRVGEEVAVAQSYFDTIVLHDGSFSNIGVASPLLAKAGAKNKMFVRADLMPHRIRITNVCVELLQDISDEDCLKEGLEFDSYGFYVNYHKESNTRTWLGNFARSSFAELFDRISGKGTWDRNPYVFVYDFQLIK